MCVPANLWQTRAADDGPEPWSPSRRPLKANHRSLVTFAIQRLQGVTHVRVQN